MPPSPPRQWAETRPRRVSGCRSVGVFARPRTRATIPLEGDAASGRAYISELMHGRDGSSHVNRAVYHDRYRRTPDGWKFTERTYEIKYVDTSPLAGSAPAIAESTS